LKGPVETPQIAIPPSPSCCTASPAARAQRTLGEAAPSAKRHVHVRANRVVQPNAPETCTHLQNTLAPALLPLSIRRAHARDRTRGKCLLVARALNQDTRAPCAARARSGSCSCPCPARPETSLDVSAVRVLFRCSCANRRPRESGIRAAVAVPNESCDVVRCSCCANTFQSAVAPSDDRICTESSPYPESPSMLCS
jgi:hypothetical protein